jgi:tRNA threonylcarbamoyladenosine modification (KEOPS) complex  Pcc1 subunit
MITCKIIIAINQSNPYEHFNKSSNKSKVNFALKKKKKPITIVIINVKDVQTS